MRLSIPVWELSLGITSVVSKHKSHPGHGEPRDTPEIQLDLGSKDFRDTSPFPGAIPGCWIIPIPSRPNPGAGASLGWDKILEKRCVFPWEVGIQADSSRSWPEHPFPAGSTSGDPLSGLQKHGINSRRREKHWEHMEPGERVWTANLGWFFCSWEVSFLIKAALGSWIGNNTYLMDGARRVVSHIPGEWIPLSYSHLRFWGWGFSQP